MQETGSRQPTITIEDAIPAIIKLVKRNCFKFKVPLHDENDIVADIVVKVITVSPSVGTSYLQRFDNTKNTMEGFLSGLIFNYFRRRFTRATHPVEQASQIDEVFTAEVASDDVPIESCSSELHWIADKLDRQFLPTTGVLYNEPVSDATFVAVVTYANPPTPQPGQVVIWRSVANILRLLYSGLAQEEIATVMRVSRGWVSKQTFHLKDDPDLRDWAADMDLPLDC